jgi:predicted transposase/invertase (TIGR01784 family)
MHLMWLSDQTSYRNDAIEEGFEEGHKKGIEKGIEKGEYKKAASIALKALEMGMSIEDTSKLTGLSEQQIEKLKTDL